MKVLSLFFYRVRKSSYATKYRATLFHNGTPDIGFYHYFCAKILNMAAYMVQLPGYAKMILEGILSGFFSVILVRF